MQWRRQRSKGSTRFIKRGRRARKTKCRRCGRSHAPAEKGEIGCSAQVKDLEDVLFSKMGKAQVTNKVIEPEIHAASANSMHHDMSCVQVYTWAVCACVGSERKECTLRSQNTNCTSYNRSMVVGETICSLLRNSLSPVDLRHLRPLLSSS